MSDSSSRFSGSPTYTIGDAASSGVKELFRPRIPSAGTTAVSHRVVAGDRLDLLAYRYFGDPAQYFRIVDANPCARPEDLLEIGRVLQIPQVS